MVKRNYNCWEDIEDAYRDACSMSCKPSPPFRNPGKNEVLDEEKSVRWNREEVLRLRAEYEEEVKRLNSAKNAAIVDVTKHAIRMIASETGLSEEKARVLWNFIYDKYHSYYGELFGHIEEYVELVDNLLN